MSLFIFLRKSRDVLGFLSSSVVKNPPAKQETGVQSLGQKDPLEKETATHSNMLTWIIPWREEPDGLWWATVPRIKRVRNF